MSKEAQSEVLLSDEQINKEWPDDVFSVNDLYSDILQHVKVVCKAQLKAAVEWLDEPCTEHFWTRTAVEQGKGFSDDIMRIVEINKWAFNHRRDCPVCWAELKREAGMPGTNSHETP